MVVRDLKPQLMELMYGVLDHLRFQLVVQLKEVHHLLLVTLDIIVMMEPLKVILTTGVRSEVVEHLKQILLFHLQVQLLYIQLNMQIIVLHLLLCRLFKGLHINLADIW